MSDLPPIPVVRLGEHMPMSTRRVVAFYGHTAYGAVLVRDMAHNTHYEMTPAQARAAAEALSRAAIAVEQWQEYASGFNRVRVRRTEEGAVLVTHRGRTRPMRLSRLRPSRRLVYVDGKAQRITGRNCGHCRQRSAELWVAADDLREHGIRVHHVEVCPGCVDRLAAEPETRLAEVRPLRAQSP